MKFSFIIGFIASTGSSSFTKASSSWHSALFIDFITSIGSPLSARTSPLWNLASSLASYINKFMDHTTPHSNLKVHAFLNNHTWISRTIELRYFSSQNQLTQLFFRPCILLIIIQRVWGLLLRFVNKALKYPTWQAIVRPRQSTARLLWPRPSWGWPS